MSFTTTANGLVMFKQRKKSPPNNKRTKSQNLGDVGLLPLLFFKMNKLNVLLVKFWTQKQQWNPGSITIDLMREINKRTEFSGSRSTIKKQSIQENLEDVDL